MFSAFQNFSNPSGGLIRKTLPPPPQLPPTAEQTAYANSQNQQNTRPKAPEGTVYFAGQLMNKNSVDPRFLKAGI